MVKLHVRNKLEGGAPVRFAKAYVEITNVCNRSCSFCPKTTRPDAFLSREDFETIMSRLSGWTEYLYFHLMGEPLLHPRLGDYLRLAGERGFRVILTTNATLLPQTGPTLLSAPALHKVNLSLQSFEANEGGCLEDYVNQCAAFAKEAAARGVLINFRLWNLDGDGTTGRNSENERILSCLSQTFPQPWTPSRGGQTLAPRVYLNWGKTFRWPDLKETDVRPHHFCYGLRDQLGVLCDGTVVPCCLDHEGDIPLGNLLQEDLQTILDRPRTRAMIAGFQRAEAVEPLCQRCGYANRFTP